MAPGSHRPLLDRWGSFPQLARALPGGALAVVDERVARLHPDVLRSLRRRAPLAVVQVEAGEGAKRLAELERVLMQAKGLPRSGALLAVGGGTIGDLSTVAAHLHKRGVRLVQVPTTLLAAVDSSVGGKGALNLGGVKNVLGVFHYAEESWLCPELFETLSDVQRREGAIEAWKMVACLDARRWRAYRRSPPSLEQLVRDARALKAAVCRKDPYEQRGVRQVLNFGHTFGHVLESLSDYRISHGDAVGLGVLCALDVGRALGVTPVDVATEVEAGFAAGPKSLGRDVLASALKRYRATPDRVGTLLAADKKNERVGAVTMVLLTALGRTVLAPVGPKTWRPLLARWTRGAS